MSRKDQVRRTIGGVGNSGGNSVRAAVDVRIFAIRAETSSAMQALGMVKVADWRADVIALRLATRSQQRGCAEATSMQQRWACAGSAQTPEAMHGARLFAIHTAISNVSNARRMGPL
jgi:hypothetical protein